MHDKNFEEVGASFNPICGKFDREYSPYEPIPIFRTCEEIDFADTG